MSNAGQLKPDNTILGAALKQYFWHKNVTTAELGERLGVSKATASRLLNGRPVETATFLKLLTILMEPES